MASSLVTVRNFREVLVKIAQDLRADEAHTVAYLTDLPVRFRDESPLVILEQMEERGIISRTNLEPLLEALKAIHRTDLIVRAREALGMTAAQPNSQDDYLVCTHEVLQQSYEVVAKCLEELRAAATREMDAQARIQLARKSSVHALPHVRKMATVLQKTAETLNLASPDSPQPSAPSHTLESATPGTPRTNTKGELYTYS